MPDYASIIAFAQEIDAWRDPYNHHPMRTGRIAEKMADAMRMAAHEKELFVIAANLHDLGKVLIPNQILHQPRRLSPHEMEIVRLHTVFGYEIALNLKYDRLICDVLLHHHENWNGTGYPDKLNGAEISIYARAMRIIDVWDALNSPRAYRKAFDEYEATRMMLTEKGLKYDGELVDLFFAKVYGRAEI